MRILYPWHKLWARVLARKPPESGAPGPAVASGALEGADTIRIAIALSDTDIERIAGRTAELLRADRSRGPDESPYLTIEEAAAYLRCRRQRVDDLLSQRRLGRIKDGSRTLISRAELEAYLRRDDGHTSAARWGSAA